MAAALCLLLILLSLLGCLISCPFSSTSLTLLALVLSTSFPFIFSKIRQLHKTSYINEPKLDILPEDVSSENEVESDSPLPELAYGSSGSSEGSISDEESLIEITLPEGHYVAPAIVHQDPRKGVSLPADFSQHGLMELFSEICEEDNLIEIDIAMGSIKSSRFELEA